MSIPQLVRQYTMRLMPETGSRGKRTDPKYQAQDILSRRDHSEHEVRTKLARKGFTPEIIDQTVEWLRETNLLSDERFARLFVENTLRFKNVGPRWLVHKLQEKRVAPEHIEPAVYSAVDETKELELAQAAANSWRRSHTRYANDRTRLMRFLVQRGFSSEVVENVLSSSNEDA